MRQSYHSDHHDHPSSSSMRQSQSLQYRPPIMRNSTSSLQPPKNPQFQPMLNTTAQQSIHRFCAQQKLLAEKDFRIQELIQQKMNYRSEGRYLQDQLHRLAQLNNNNENEIKSLKIVNQKLQTELHNKNIMLTQLLTKSEQQHKYNDNLSKQLQYLSNLLKQQQPNQHKLPESGRNEYEKEKQFQNCAGRQLERQHESIYEELKRVESQLNFAYNQIAQLLGSEHQIDDYLFQSHSSQASLHNQPRQNWPQLISYIHNTLLTHRQQIQNNQSLQQQINTLSQTIRLQVQQNNKLQEQNNILNQNLLAKSEQFKYLQEQIMHLHGQLEFVSKEKEKEKERKEVEMLALKYEIEGQKNQLAMEIQNIKQNNRRNNQNQENIDQNGDNQIQNQFGKEDKDYVIRKLRKKLLKFESIIQKKDMHIRILQQNLDSQRERSKKVMAMATEFDKWFQTLNEQNYLSKSSLYYSTVKSISKETGSLQNNSYTNSYQ